MIKHNVLWTGGFDSTYIILSLSRQNVEIQPFYCFDDKRKSINYEYRAIENIYNFLINNKNTKAKLLKPKFIRIDDIEKNEAITNAYHSIRKKTKIGTQYEYLSRLANNYPGLEMGVEKHINGFGGLNNAVSKYGSWICTDGIKYIDKNKSSNDIVLLFGNFIFSIATLTEQDMLNNIHSWEYDDVLNMVWFCHDPINGKPCGLCRPCQQKMEDKMEMLLPIESQQRYKKRKQLKNKYGEFVAKLYFYIYKKLLIFNKLK